MMITDSGIHIWLPQAPDRPWMPGRTAHLPEPLTYQRLNAMMDEAGVGHAILVPPSWEGERIDYSLEAAQKFPNRFAVMGRFPINVPEERARLETWRQQKGRLGVRLTLHHEWDRAWMRDGTADWFWPAAERLGIPVMLNAPFSHKEIGEVAARHPRLRIILDHLGASTSQKNDALEPQVESTASLARHPNVHVKLTLVRCSRPTLIPTRTSSPISGICWRLLGRDAASGALTPRPCSSAPAAATANA
jgi:predicted TIM-barrel fold metal-dependent hydrolase